MPRYQVELQPEAVEEAQEAYDYLLRRNPTAAEQFRERLRGGVRELSETAHAWDAATPRARRYRLTQFPYALIYRIDGDVVVVGAVMHLRRRPDYRKA